MTSKTLRIVLAFVMSSAIGPNISASPYAKWENGPSQDAKFFPIAVWLQNPRNAGKYRQAGINTYVGLWRGPTEQQLSDTGHVEVEPGFLPDLFVKIFSFLIGYQSHFQIGFD